MRRVVYVLAAALVIAMLSALTTPAFSDPLPIPGLQGLNPSVLSEAETFFSGATSKASPATMQKINDLLGLFKSGAQNGTLTDGTSQIQSVFPQATTEQQAVLRTTGFSGLLSKLDPSDLGKLGVGNIQSLVSQFGQSNTLMNDILSKTHDTPSSVLSHL